MLDFLGVSIKLRLAMENVHQITLLDRPMVRLAPHVPTTTKPFKLIVEIVKQDSRGQEEKTKSRKKKYLKNIIGA